MVRVPKRVEEGRVVAISIVVLGAMVSVDPGMVVVCFFLVVTVVFPCVTVFVVVLHIVFVFLTVFVIFFFFLNAHSQTFDTSFALYFLTSGFRTACLFFNFLPATGVT